MELNVFSNEIKSLAETQDILINDEQINKLYTYMNLLINWNEKMNLTAITEPKEIILKHFIDSLTIQKYVKHNDKLIDIGTGAGFPGIPVGITNSSANITLMDSLNKRINFLNEVVTVLDLKNIKTIHARAEELATNKTQREQYNIATSRAVASLNILIEYMLPFVKIGGYCICMKGSNIEEEVQNAQKAIEILGGKIETIESFNLANSNNFRNIIVIKKIKETPRKYPRKAGTPSKEPIK